MRKNISVTNERVLKAMSESENASKLIEKAVVYYLDSIEGDSISIERLETLEEKVCTLNEKYTLYEELLFNICKYLGFNQG